MAYLYKNINKNKYVFDKTNEVWYCINEFGIYEIDKKGDVLRNKINTCIVSAVKKEYNRLLEIHKNNSDERKIIFDKYQAIIRYCSSAQNKDNLLKELRTLYGDSKIYEKMDTINPYLVGFDNGVYDLEHDIFRNAKPEEYISCTTKYAYKKANPVLKQHAMKLLETIISDPHELRYVLKTLSLGLYGKNPEEKVYIWQGTGANAKGLMRDIVQKVLGSYYDSMDITYLYKNNSIRAGAANPVMAKKKNARLVISTEPDSTQIMDKKILKSISGSDPVECRKLYADTFNYIPNFGLIIQTNQEPAFEAFDGGMIRRFIMITFRNKFVENPNPNILYEKLIDKTLKKKIINDNLYLNEFCEILIDHFKLYLTEQLILPERYAEETRLFIKRNDPFNSWFVERISITKNKEDLIQSSKMYDDYMEYTENDNKGITANVFKHFLQEKSVNIKRKSNANYYCNVKFNNNNV